MIIGAINILTRRSKLKQRLSKGLSILRIKESGKVMQRNISTTNKINNIKLD
jgi:hypothetical protein